MRQRASAVRLGALFVAFSALMTGCGLSSKPEPKPAAFDSAATDQMKKAWKSYVEIHERDLEGATYRNEMIAVAEQIRGALIHDNTMSYAHSRLGRIYLELGEIEEARRCFEEADRIARGDWPDSHLGMIDLNLREDGEVLSDQHRQDIQTLLRNAQVAMKNAYPTSSSGLDPLQQHGSATTAGQIASDACWRENFGANVDVGAFARQQLEADIAFRRELLGGGVDYLSFQKAHPGYWPVLLELVRGAARRRDFLTVYNLLDPYLEPSDTKGGEPKYPLLATRRELLSLWGRSAMELYTASNEHGSPRPDYAASAALAFATIMKTHTDDPGACLELASVTYLATLAAVASSEAPNFTPVRELLAEFCRRMEGYTGSDRDELAQQAKVLADNLGSAPGVAP